MNQRKKIAVILAGCGFKDGSEIHESVLTLLEIVKNNAEPICFAPAEEQAAVINHRTGEKTGESRTMIDEAARIARGKISPIASLQSQDADALILPGGFGAASNLCNFATEKAHCTVHPEVTRVIKEFYESKKPVGLICIAPVIGAKVLGSKNILLTIGSDAGTAAEIEKMGAKHCVCDPTDICVDKTNKIVSTPAYMTAKNIGEVAAGIGKLVKEVLNLSLG